MAAKCNAIARSGERCGSPALPDSSYCFVHSPDHAEARRAASVKGGRNRSAQARARAAIPPAMDAVELGGWLALVFRRVVAGQMEPKIGTAAAAIARTMMGVRELVEIEARLVALEEAASLGERRVS